MLVYEAVSGVAEHNQDDWNATVKVLQDQFAGGVWRAIVFRDMILRETESLTGPLTLLDIGCGSGFDDSPELQQSLITAADRYIGVEPDLETPVQEGIEVHRSSMEEAKIEDDSVDIAYAVMVLEHLENPKIFFDKLHRVLKPGGVFYGFTPNKRHYFAVLSTLIESLGVKDLYLQMFRANENERYANYPTRYRCNSRADVESSAADFSDVRVFALNRIGLLGYYLPKFLRPVATAFDHVWTAAGMPGPLLVCRVEKGSPGFSARNGGAS